MQYPLMAPVARYMLGVFPSQATAERVFSSSGRRHRLAFTNLDPDVLGAVVQSQVHSRAKTEACSGPSGPVLRRVRL